MIKSLEKFTAQMGYYTFYIFLAVSLGTLIPTIHVPNFLLIIMMVISLSFFVISFGTFKWKITPQQSKRRLFWGLIFAAFLFYIPLNLGLLFLGMVEPKLHDFGAYYNAAVRWLNGAPIYQTTQNISAIEAQVSNSMPYLYPPIFVLIFIPFTVFSPILSGIIWDILILLFLLWSVAQLVSTFDLGLHRRERILIFLLIVSFGPTITWMKAGQISGLLVGLLCLSGTTLRRRKQEMSGIFITLGSVVKPFYATSAAHLLRDRRRFLSALVSGMGLFGIGLLIFGIESHIDYVGVLLEGKGWGTLSGPSNWNAGHYNPFYILGPIKHLPRLAIILATAIIALYSNKRYVPIEYIFALGVAVVSIVGPTTNTLALNTAIPAILMAGLYEMEMEGTFPKLLVISSLLIHIHPYTIEFLSKFGPKIYPPLEFLTPIIPLLQPALYGTTLLVGYLSYRSLKNPVL